MTSPSSRFPRLHRVGAGPPLVLLHGLGASRMTWRGLSPLHLQFECITLDLPGHGDTPAPDEPYEIDGLAEQFAACLTADGIERAHLLGSSLGGMVALNFAATWPGRVDRMVLCDTTPAFSEGMREELLTMPDVGFAHGAMARADLMDLAEEVFARTLVLCAEGADLAMREGADFLARSMPRGELAFVPGAERDVVMEQPGWVARVVADFLR